MCSNEFYADIWNHHHVKHSFEHTVVEGEKGRLCPPHHYSPYTPPLPPRISRPSYSSVKNHKYQMSRLVLFMYHINLSSWVIFRFGQIKSINQNLAHRILRLCSIQRQSYCLAVPKLSLHEIYIPNGCKNFEVFLQKTFKFMQIYPSDTQFTSEWSELAV